MSGTNLLSPINDIDSRLAVELAVELSTVEEILKRHGLTKDELREKLLNPTFQKMFREAKQVWCSDLSVKDRARLKAATLVEDSLLGLYKLFHDSTITPSSRVEAFKNLARVATLDGPDKEGVATGDRVRVFINIGGDANPPVTIEGRAIPQLEQAAALDA